MIPPRRTTSFLLRARRRIAERFAGDPEAGQIMLLVIGYAALAAALVLVLASASAVHLERKQLFSLADAAALDAADAIDLDLFYGDGAIDLGADGSVHVPLTDDGVRAAVVEHVTSSPAAHGLLGLRVGEPTGTPDGVTAQVTLTAVARPPFLPWALVDWADGVPLRVTVSARAG